MVEKACVTQGSFQKTKSFIKSNYSKSSYDMLDAFFIREKDGMSFSCGVSTVKLPFLDYNKKRRVQPRIILANGGTA